MNDENKVIEEMAKIIRDFAKELDGKCIYLLATCEDDKLKDSVHAKIAEALYNAGYKQEKETAREILSWAERVAKPTYYNVDDNPRMENLILLSDIYKFFKEKYGVEVE